MDEAFRRAGGIFLFACLVAYGTYLLANGTFSAGKNSESEPLVIRDRIRSGEHHLSGLIFVPKTCDELSVATEKLSETSYRLAFRTWEEPSVACRTEPSVRVFDMVVFAPSFGVSFNATLDTDPIQIAVYPTILGK